MPKLSAPHTPCWFALIPLTDQAEPGPNYIIMSSSISLHAERAQASLVEKLPSAFFVLAKRDAALAIALHAQVDLVEDGCYTDALKLNRAIATRLELLAINQKE